MGRSAGLYVSLPSNADCLEVWKTSASCPRARSPIPTYSDLFCLSCCRRGFSLAPAKRNVTGFTPPPSHPVAPSLWTSEDNPRSEPGDRCCSRTSPAQSLPPLKQEAAGVASEVKGAEKDVAACGMCGVFAVGMYELVESEKCRRSGGLAFFRVCGRQASQPDRAMTAGNRAAQGTFGGNLSERNGSRQAGQAKSFLPESDLYNQEVRPSSPRVEDRSSPSPGMGLCDPSAPPCPSRGAEREQRASELGTGQQGAHEVAEWSGDRGRLLSSVVVEDLGTFDVGAGVLDFRWLPKAHLSPPRTDEDEETDKALGSRPKPCLASSLPSSVTPSPTCSSAVAAVGSDRALHVLVMCPGSPWFASSSSSSRASSFPHAASGWDCCRADWGGRSAVARGFAACAQEVRETPGTGGRPRDGALLSAEEDRSLARDSQGEAVDGEKELIRQAPGCCWTAPKPKEKEKREKANSCQVTQVARLLLLPEEVEKECGDVIGVAMDSFADDGRLTAACCSNGYASIVKDLEFVGQSWKAHDIETWCIVFDPHCDGNVLATGADDCTLCLWDIRSGLGKTAGRRGGLAGKFPGVSATPTSRNDRSHSMGVTAAAFSLSSPHLIFTGSYDENVRVFDRRQLHRPLDSFKTSGGVWRLKWHWVPSGGDAKEPLLLVAACHGGCEVWQTSDSGQGWKRLAHFSGHGSMAYGVGALSLGLDGTWRSLLSPVTDLAICSPMVSAQKGEGSVLDENLFLSCSFYDRLLAVW